MSHRDTGTDPGDDLARVGPRTSTTRRVLKVAFGLVILAAGGLAVAGYWADVRESIGRLSVLSLAMSLVAVLCSAAASMLAWRAVLDDLGSRLPLPVGARVFFMGQLGKYLPGTVWSLLAQMELARDHGVPRRRAAAAYAITMLLILAAGLFTASSALPFVSTDAAARYGWLVILAPIILAMLHPRIINPILTWIFRVLRRDPMEHPLSLRGVGMGFLLSLIVWIFLGLHLAVLVTDMGVNIGQALTLSAGAFALAWCAGLLVVFLPAGAGAREVALVALLSSVLNSGEAIVVALVSRLFMTLGDLAWAAATGASAVRSRRGAPAEPIDVRR